VSEDYKLRERKDGFVLPQESRRGNHGRRREDVLTYAHQICTESKLYIRTLLLLLSLLILIHTWRDAATFLLAYTRFAGLQFLFLCFFHRLFALLREEDLCLVVRGGGSATAGVARVARRIVGCSVAAAKPRRDRVERGGGSLRSLSSSSSSSSSSFFFSSSSSSFDSSSVTILVSSFFSSFLFSFTILP
jgi:hypothetical protein